MTSGADPEASPGRRTSLSLGIERLGLLSLRFPYVVLAIVIALTAVAAFGITNLKVDDSLSELFRSDTQDFRDYQTLSRRFPSSEYDVLVVVEGKDLLARPVIEKLRNLAIELQFVDGMSGLISMFSAREAPVAGKIPAPLFPNELPTGEAYDRLIEQVRANKIISGKVLSNDGTLALIVLALDPKIVQETGAKPIIAQIRETSEEQLKGTDLSVQLSGAPVMQLEIRNAVERDRNLYNGLGLIFAAAIAITFFRRLSLTLIASLPPIIAITWSLGLFGWLGFKLNLFLNVMTPLIMVLGFSDSMQLTVAMRDRLIAGDGRSAAARYAVLVVGPACVLATATAMVSFGTLLFGESALIRTFGIAGILSTAIAFIVGITLVPLLTCLLVRKESSFTAAFSTHDRAMNAIKRFAGWLAEIGVRYSRVVLACGLAIVVAFGAIYAGLSPRYRLADQVPDREQARSASQQLDTKLTGANPIDVMIDYPKNLDLYSPEVLDTIAEVHRIVEKQSGLGNVWSVETLRRWLDEAGDLSTETLKRYVELLPEHLTHRFIDPPEHSAVVTGRIPDVDISALLPVVNSLDTQLETVRKAHPSFRIVVSGLSAIAARNSSSMIGKLNAGLTWEIVIICVFLGLAFRSAMVTFVTILPNLFPIFTAGAILAATGEGLQFASIVALVVSFALSLNATVHYLNRLRLEDRSGEDPAVSVKRATILIGPALVLTTLILAFGLGVTVLSDLPSLRLFGRLTALTLLAALIGDLLILPASVLLFRRLFRRTPSEASSAAD